MHVSFHGQSRLAVESDGKSLLFDPFIRPDELARDVDVSAVRAGGILIAHSHFDHVADVAEPAGRPGAPVIADGAVCRWLETGAVGSGTFLKPVGSSRGF